MRKTFLFLVPQQCSPYLLFTYQVKSAIDIYKLYRKTDARLTRLKEDRESKITRSKEIQRFIDNLRSQQEPIAVWNEQAWNLLVTQVTIRSDGSAEFLFRGENTITVRAD